VVALRTLAHGRARSGAAYRRLLVPLDGGAECEECVAQACLVVLEGGLVVAVFPVEVPLAVPFETPLPAEEGAAHAALERALALGQAYGVDVKPRLVRTRSRGEAVVAQAGYAGVDAIVVAYAVGRRLAPTTEFVLRHAPCRVLVVAL